MSNGERFGTVRRLISWLCYWPWPMPLRGLRDRIDPKYFWRCYRCDRRAVVKEPGLTFCLKCGEAGEGAS